MSHFRVIMMASFRSRIENEVEIDSSTYNYDITLKHSQIDHILVCCISNWIIRNVSHIHEMFDSSCDTSVQLFDTRTGIFRQKTRKRSIIMIVTIANANHFQWINIIRNCDIYHFKVWNIHTFNSFFNRNSYLCWVQSWQSFLRNVVWFI